MPNSMFHTLAPTVHPLFTPLLQRRIFASRPCSKQHVQNPCPKGAASTLVHISISLSLLANFSGKRCETDHASRYSCPAASMVLLLAEFFFKGITYSSQDARECQTECFGHTRTTEAFMLSLAVLLLGDSLLQRYEILMTKQTRMLNSKYHALA